MKRRAVWAITIGLVVIVVLVLAVTALTNRRQAANYQLLATTPNQACIGLSEAQSRGYTVSLAALKASGRLYAHDVYGRIAGYDCIISLSSPPSTIQGKYVPSLPFGAQVTYFKSAQEAQKYAEKQINPQRYWGIDERGQRDGIPQTSLFTFLVTDQSPMYFDSYTVRENALIRLTQTCDFGGGKGDSTVLDKCAGDLQASTSMQSVLKAFADQVKPLSFN